ncbi:MAG: hypothetical protein RLZZ584_3047 [Pseudomonadota bacterium]
MAHASRANDHNAAAPGHLTPVLGEPALARPASRDELDAWARLDRLQGPGERRAVLLALLLTEGSLAEQQAWVSECRDVPQAALAQALVGQLGDMARPAALERVLHDCQRAPQGERVELLRSARRLMCADGRVGPLDRLRWLYMRQCLAAGEPGVGTAAASSSGGDSQWDDLAQRAAGQPHRPGAHSLPDHLKLPASRLTSYLARLVPQADPQSKVGTLGVAWHRAVMTELWGDDVPACRLPDGDQLAQALAQVQELSWMQRPQLARTWVEAAFVLARRRAGQRSASLPPAGQAFDVVPTQPMPLGPAGEAGGGAADGPVPASTGEPLAASTDFAGLAGAAPETMPASLASLRATQLPGAAVAAHGATAATATPSTSTPAAAGLPDTEALHTLRLACRMIDTPLPPELARVFIEHPLAPPAA